MQPARFLLEDMLVAKGRLARLSSLYPQRRTFGHGKAIPILVAHREVADRYASDLATAGGVEACSEAERNSAKETARTRLRGDKEAGFCLCHLTTCDHSLTEARP